MLIWLAFVLCLAVIGVAGVKLSHYADAIADKTGVGRAWVGLVLLATITSLPELVTGVSSVTVAQVPEIALGDVLGSCVFNMLIIVVLDFLHRGETMYSQAAPGHILAGGFGIMLIGIVGFSILISAIDLPLSDWTCRSVHASDLADLCRGNSHGIPLRSETSSRLYRAGARQIPWLNDH